MVLLRVKHTPSFLADRPQAWSCFFPSSWRDLKCHLPSSPVFPPFSLALFRGKLWTSSHNSHALPPCLIEVGGWREGATGYRCCCHALYKYRKPLSWVSTSLHQPLLKRLLPLPSLASTCDIHQESRAGVGMTPLPHSRLPVNSGTLGLLSSLAWKTFPTSLYQASSPFRRRGPHPPSNHARRHPRRQVA